MKKKNYLQPTMMVVTMQQQAFICTSNGVNSVESNAGFGFGGGGKGPARSRQQGADFDDWE